MVAVLLSFLYCCADMQIPVAVQIPGSKHSSDPLATGDWPAGS
jgi:hypothetical protein